MSHAIDFSNDRANIAYVNEVPWHGLGHKLHEKATIAEWTAAAGLDWSANIEPMYTKRKGEFIEIPDQIVLTRSDTDSVLGTFTNHYVPAQPAQIMEFFQTFILADRRFKMETAGALKGGKVIWALARFHEDMVVVGETHVPYVLLTTSFDGTLATTAQATMVRVVCKNTLGASLFDPAAATVKVRHNKAFDGIVMGEAHSQLATIAESFESYRKVAEALVSIKITRDQTQKFFEALIPKPETKKDAKKPVGLTRYTNTMADLNNLLNKTVQEGAEAGRGWTVFNAVTDYVDHRKGTKKTNGETEDNARMYSSFFGTGVQLKSKAMRDLLALADTTVLDVLAGEESGGREFELAA